MVNCYPVIFTKTLKCDYYSGLSAKPDFVDVKWAMKYIFGATAEIDTLEPNGRKVVFSNGTYTIFGIVTHTEEIVNRSNRTDLLPYIRDEKGRKNYGFWGFAVKCGGYEVPMPDYSKYAELVEKFIVPVWMNTSMEDKCTSETIALNSTHAGVLPTPAVSGNGHSIYREDERLFAGFIEKSMKSAVSFCSGITAYPQIMSTPFEHISASENCIARFKADLSKPKPEPKPVTAETTPEVKPAANTAAPSNKPFERLARPDVKMGGMNGTNIGSGYDSKQNVSGGCNPIHIQNNRENANPYPNQKTNMNGNYPGHNEGRSSRNFLVPLAVAAVAAVVVSGLAIKSCNSETGTKPDPPTTTANMDLETGTTDMTGIEA